MPNCFVSDSPPFLLDPPVPPRAAGLRWQRLHGAAFALAIAEAARKTDGAIIVVADDQRQLDLLLAELHFFVGDAEDNAGDGDRGSNSDGDNASESASDGNNASASTNVSASKNANTTVNLTQKSNDADHNNKIQIREFPAWECLPYDIFSPHPDIISKRLQILANLARMQRIDRAERLILLTTCANLMQRLAPREYIAAHAFSLRQGDTIDRDALRAQMIEAHYAAVKQVMAPGEFAFRGGLIDVYPMGADAPFRLDLFDDEIESIRRFDADTQRSVDAVASIELLPAREFPMNAAGIERFRGAFRRHFEGDPRAQRVYAEISAGVAPPGAEFYLPLFFERTATLFDYLRDDALWVVGDNFAETARVHAAEIEDRRQHADYDRTRRVLPASMLYLDADEITARIESQRRIVHVGAGQPGDWRAPTAPGKTFAVDAREASPYQKFLAHIEAASPQRRILIATETAGRREAMDGLLRHHQLHTASCETFAQFARDATLTRALCVHPLERALCLPALEIICESQLYGERAMHNRRRRRGAQDPESIIRSLAELHIGDPVVHIDHGVGRYLGLRAFNTDGLSADGESNRQSNGQSNAQSSESSRDESKRQLDGKSNTESHIESERHTGEFLALEYQHGDKLYVPVLSLHLISRFVGGDQQHAPLHQLGGERWQKVKRKAREKAHDVAAELLEVAALRGARKGVAMTPPGDEYQSFVGRFGFDETPDQQRAIDEVLADLKSDAPMERLVCGDVGFGKTEVALRAAFVAVHNNRQVALLTPTTLLAGQHYETFTDRFAELSVSIGMLSRFKTKKQAAELIAQLKTGQPDIIIGTHRLLQKDVNFKRLGLLIIDEEHRFGVRQKERIKQLRSQVDLLTLTATPIPRTLNLALSGLRDISLIATAPQLRLSVKTFIREWSHALVREACLREIRRGGQVYFVHNEVRTMTRFVEQLSELLPEATIQFAHGQLGEVQLERVMQDFYHRRFNVLVCSTIIESGLDVASANTIIINRADRFGLAQLHQLRGRVGRSHHQAFAYLLVPEGAPLRGDARKRLDAFEKMDELGAGFALASHDLEIRGAGELLGETQSGLIDEVGFSLYGEYLKLAVADIKAGDNANDRHAQLYGDRVVDDSVGVNGNGKSKSDSDSHGDRASKGTMSSKSKSKSKSTSTSPSPFADERLRAPTIDLHIAALFPETYLGNPHARLVLYKRIAHAPDLHALYELQVETIDRFGLLPEVGKNLFRLTALRLCAQQLGVRTIDVGEQGGVIEFSSTPRIDAEVVLQLVRDEPQRYQLNGPSGVRIEADLSDSQTRIECIEQLLERFGARAVLHCATS